MCLFSSVFRNVTIYVNWDPVTDLEFVHCDGLFSAKPSRSFGGNEKENIKLLFHFIITPLKLWKVQIKSSILVLYLFLDLEKALVIALNIDQKWAKKSWHHGEIKVLAISWQKVTCKLIHFFQFTWWNSSRHCKDPTPKESTNSSCLSEKKKLEVSHMSYCKNFCVAKEVFFISRLYSTELFLYWIFWKTGQSAFRCWGEASGIVLCSSYYFILFYFKWNARSNCVIKSFSNATTSFLLLLPMTSWDSVVSHRMTESSV